jgi:hypothetical protein
MDSLGRSGGGPEKSGRVRPDEMEDVEAQLSLEAVSYKHLFPGQDLADLPHMGVWTLPNLMSRAWQEVNLRWTFTRAKTLGEEVWTRIIFPQYLDRKVAEAYVRDITRQSGDVGAIPCGLLNREESIGGRGLRSMGVRSMNVPDIGLNIPPKASAASIDGLAVGLLDVDVDVWGIMDGDTGIPTGLVYRLSGARGRGRGSGVNPEKSGSQPVPVRVKDKNFW